MKQKEQGFTLVEISIVIVIIGFLIAGLLMGQSILRNSSVRAITAEAASYTLAISNFRDKYQALPGDFAGASSVWSGVSNGNGDGLITINISNANLAEQFLAWQHLAKAEMIKGSYTGAAGSGGVRDRIYGSNVPASELKKAGWGLISVTLTDIAGGYTQIPYTAPDIVPNHVLWLGGSTVTATADSQNPVLLPQEASDIDTKSDDGLPGSGKIVAQANGTTGTCSNSATDYDVTSNNLYCTLVFKTGF